MPLVVETDFQCYHKLIPLTAQQFNSYNKCIVINEI